MLTRPPDRTLISRPCSSWRVSINVGVCQQKLPGEIMARQIQSNMSLNQFTHTGHFLHCPTIMSHQLRCVRHRSEAPNDSLHVCLKHCVFLKILKRVTNTERFNTEIKIPSDFKDGWATYLSIFTFWSWCLAVCCQILGHSTKTTRHAIWSTLSNGFRKNIVTKTIVFWWRNGWR